MTVFELQSPKSPLPIVLSIPHSGTDFPSEFKGGMVPDLLAQMPDTDWHVEKLYDFAVELGVTVVKANYSRYLIDLNRDPAGMRLYDDDRQETRLVPIQTFSGLQLYTWAQPSAESVADRIQQFYEPYHKAIEEQLAKLRSTFSNVLLIDAHSIKSSVPSIAPGRFPDLILGDVDGQSADERLSIVAVEALKESGLQVERNRFFKGGFITRSKHNRDNGIHCLQLEMVQDVYMNELTNEFDPSKAAKIRTHLSATLQRLAEALRSL